MQSSSVYYLAPYSDIYIIYRRLLLRSVVRYCTLFKRFSSTLIGYLGFTAERSAISAFLRRKNDAVGHEKRDSTFLAPSRHSNSTEISSTAAPKNNHNNCNTATITTATLLLRTVGPRWRILTRKRLLHCPFTMMRNIEIKASIRDVEALKLKAKELSGSDATIIQQTDTFFKVPKGRMKLRQFKDGTGELIYYDRPDTAGPKLSTYQKVDCPDDSYSRGLLEILRLSIGILGTVEKTRYLYLVGQSRVHIDDVLDLGAFAEIEVVLTSDQTIEDGQKIMANLMKELGIEEDALLSTAYLDIILAKNHSANT